MAGKRLAGVNSFGFGGTNCHVIIEQPPARAVRPEPTNCSGVLLVSARTPSARTTIARRTLQRLLAAPPSAVLDLVMSTNRSLRQFPHRIAIAFSDRDELLKRLAAYLGDERTPLVSSGRAPYRHGIQWRFGLAEWRPDTDRVQELCRAFSVFDDAFRAWRAHFTSSAGLARSEQERDWLAAECALAAWLSAVGLTPTEVHASGFARVCSEALGSVPTPTSEGILQDPASLPAASREPLWSEARGGEGSEAASSGIGGASPVLVLTPLDATHSSHTPSPLALDQVDQRGLLDLVVRAFSLGARIDSRALFSDDTAQVLVASYPFERETYQAGTDDAEFESRRTETPSSHAAGSVRAVSDGPPHPRLNEAQRARLSRVFRDALGGSTG